MFRTMTEIANDSTMTVEARVTEWANTRVPDFEWQDTEPPNLYAAALEMGLEDRTAKRIAREGK